MSKTSMHASLKAKHKKGSCLPPTRPSKDWKGQVTPPVPEVAQPMTLQECPAHYEYAVAGSELSLPKVG